MSDSGDKLCTIPIEIYLLFYNQFKRTDASIKQIIYVYRRNDYETNYFYKSCGHEIL